MQRMFLEDVGRIRRGEIRDYPHSTWRDFYPDFRRQTAPVELVAPLGAGETGARGADINPAAGGAQQRPGGGRRA